MHGTTIKMKLPNFSFFITTRNVFVLVDSKRLNSVNIYSKTHIHMK